MAVERYMCPSCGTEVEVGSKCTGCPPEKKRRKLREKAAVARKKAWQQGQVYDGLGLPDDEFDYEGFVQREFGGKPHRQVGLKWYWWVTGAVLAGAMAVALFGGLW
ncbi:MAG: hypothetical protein HKN82_14380 [Akkermansiaceae bacterium]|nr:hypothetical protein [Akkermansiaceae bacterium]NNM28283.1 hypothetical protein [Akkermansiaceae bacterium]